MLRDGFAEDVVQATVERLRAERYLDDAAFAARFARSRLAWHGLGRRRVSQGLRARGVAGETAASGIREALTEVSETEALNQLARRYWRQRHADEPRSRLRKLWAFALRRGYAPEHVQRVLRALWPRLQDAIEGLEPVDEGETTGEA